jgi:hypothetical protein
MSHSAFIIFDTIFQLTFFPIRHFVPFVIYYIRHYFPSKFFSIRHYVPFGIFFTFVLMSFNRFVPFDVLSFRRFLSFNVFSVDLLSNSTFCPSTFFTVGVFYLDVSSVNRILLLLYSTNIVHSGPPMYHATVVLVI